MKIAVLCGLLFMGLTLPALATSFDCTKADKAVEKMICTDTELSKLDEEVAAAYTTALARTNDKEDLKNDQKKWLRIRNNCNKHEDLRLCIKNKYLEALSSLQSASNLKPFVFQPGKQNLGTIVDTSQQCEFTGLLLPADYSLFAAGAYSGRKLSFQIDQSGHQATQIDVAVNSPSKPVVLMLGAYEPTIWNIGWSQGTNILAVIASGYHRQVIAGLEKKIPTIISSSNNKGACDYFYITETALERLNPFARKLFDRPVDMVFPAKNGKVTVGDLPTPETTFITSTESLPESYYDKSAPLAGLAGIEDALQKGILRKATNADAEDWITATERAKPPKDIPPIAGQGSQKPRKSPFGPDPRNVYVVLKDFVYPAGLYGGNSACFIIPKGVPMPKGNPGHSDVYDFNTLTCNGPSPWGSQLQRDRGGYIGPDRFEGRPGNAY